MKTIIKGYGLTSRWPATHDEMKVYFGEDPKKHWPDNGLPVREIQGVLVWVDSKWTAKQEGRTFRVRCQCPNCKAFLAPSRLPQHKCKA